MSKLSATQSAALAALNPYGKIRSGNGRINMPVICNGLVIMPRTFNSLVDRGLAWGIDGNRQPYVGRLGTSTGDA